MNLFPIIVRELRTEARNSVNHGMRLLSVGALLAVMGYILWKMQKYFAGGSHGGEIFAFMSLLTFWGIWIITPLLASDCLSRERREGTLGLLFLTPLRSLEIVLGKSFIHLLRATTSVVATIPMLAIPFLLGGIALADIWRVLCLCGAALLLSQAAGVLASSFCQNWMSSIVLTAVISAIFAYFFCYLPLALAHFSLTTFSNVLGDWDGVISWLFFLYNGGRIARPTALSPLQASVLLLIISSMVFVWVIIFVARRLGATWQDKPPTERQRRWNKTFFTANYFTGLLRWKNRRQLTRNPVGWLQQYSWTARLSKWGWCLFAVVLDCWFVTLGNANDLSGSLIFASYLVLISMSFSAVSSFQREKQTGGLELLLVTPLSERQIIRGRLGGIWMQYLPAMAVLMLSLILFESWWISVHLLLLLKMILAFLFIPILGLYFALRLKNVIAAWIITLAIYWWLPSMLFAVGDWLSGRSFYYYFGSREWRELGAAVFSTLFCIMAGRLLYRQLKSRSFALGKG